MGHEIIKGICGGLSYVHGECHIGHPNLKPENILMDATMVPKIVDFGSSRIFSDKRPRIITQNCLWIRGYMSREYISIRMDIFSLGVVTTKTQSRIFGGKQFRIISKKRDIWLPNIIQAGLHQVRHIQLGSYNCRNTYKDLWWQAIPNHH